MDFIIRNPKADEIQMLKDLWKITFGDTDMFLDLFFKGVDIENECVCAFLQEKLVGMLFVMPSELKTKTKNYNSLYVYGVATKKEYRHKGVMSSLMLAAENIAKENDCKCIGLVPQNDDLFSMYEKFDYKTVSAYNLSEIPVSAIQTGKIIECSKEKFYAMRKNIIDNNTYTFDLNNKYNDMRYKVLKIYGNIFFYESVSEKGYSVVELNDGVAYIKETNLSVHSLSNVATYLKVNFNVRKIVLWSCIGKLKKYMMIKILDKKIQIKENVYTRGLLE